MSRCEVEDTELEFYLIQIEPGRERDLDQVLRTHEEGAKAQDRLPWMVRYKCLGKYDMLCLTEAGTLKKDWLEDYCIDFEQVRCFVWREGENDKSVQRILNADRTYDWIALSFVKIDPSFLCQSGEAPVVRERTLVEKIIAELNTEQMEALALGGFGWHEMVLLVWHNDLADLAKRILTIPVFAGENGEICPIVKTFTIFGLHYDYLRTEKAKQVESRSWEKLDKLPHSDIHLKVFVTSSSLPTIALEKPLLDLLASRMHAVFGTEDLVLTPPPEQGLGTLLHRLVQMRQAMARKMKGAIYSTSTVVQLERDAPPQGEAKPFPKVFGGFAEESVDALLKEGIGFTSSRDKEEEDDSPYLVDARRLRKQLHWLLRASLRNRLTRDAYIDMIFSLAAFRHTSDDETSFKLSETATKNFLDYVSLGYQERSWSTMNSLWNVGNPAPLFYRGGIQRVLWAAESVATSLLKEPAVWYGFIVFGLTRDYLRSHIGVMSLPHRVMFQPEEWWGLFHEIGHEFVSQIGKRKIGKEWRTRLGAIYSVSDAEFRGKEREERHFANIAWEILADKFDLEWGFAGDWNLYVHTVVNYLLEFGIVEDFEESLSKGYGLSIGSTLRDKVDFYLVRLVAAWCFHKGYATDREVDLSFMSEQVKPLFERRLKKAADRYPEGIDNLRVHLDHIFEPDYLANCCQRYRLWQLIFSGHGQELIQTIFGGRKPPQEKEDGAVEALKNGCVLTTVSDPARVIRHLLRLTREFGHQQLPAKIKIAAILSLWNAYAETLPSRLEELAEVVKK